MGEMSPLGVRGPINRILKWAPKSLSAPDCQLLVTHCHTKQICNVLLQLFRGY